jgi:hypothetical protein
VTIAKRPFVWAGMAADRGVICVRRKQQYFCKGDWTGSIKLIPKENFFSVVIPGRTKHEPGIHNHRGDYGFRACAKRRIPE